MKTPAFLLEPRKSIRFEQLFEHVRANLNDEDDETEHWEEDEEDWDD